MSQFNSDTNEILLEQQDRKQYAKQDDWDYQPDRAAIAKAMASATQHYLGVRATALGGVKALEGGPSWPIGIRTVPGFEFAAGQARGWWPNATTFDLIQSEAHMDMKRVHTLDFPPGCTILRMATVILQFTCPAQPSDPGWQEPARGTLIGGGHVQ